MPSEKEANDEALRAFHMHDELLMKILWENRVAIAIMLESTALMGKDYGKLGMIALSEMMKLGKKVGRNYGLGDDVLDACQSIIADETFAIEKIILELRDAADQ